MRAGLDAPERPPGLVCGRHPCPARKGDSDPPLRPLPLSGYHGKTGIEQVLPSVGGITSAQGRRFPGHFFGDRSPFWWPVRKCEKKRQRRVAWLPCSC